MPTKNTFASIKQWAPRFHERVVDVARGEMMEHLLERYMRRLEKDLNRIAQSRLAAGSMTGVLLFTVSRAGPKELVIKPSDPVLFKKLEFGEFNPDGTLKVPPHSVLAEWKATVRL